MWEYKEYVHLCHINNYLSSLGTLVFDWYKTFPDIPAKEYITESTWNSQQDSFEDVYGEGAYEEKSEGIQSPIFQLYL